MEYINKIIQINKKVLITFKNIFLKFMKISFKLPLVISEKICLKFVKDKKIKKIKKKNL